MRYDNLQGWVDVTPAQSWLRPPQVIVRAADITEGAIRADADLYAATTTYRDMFYDTKAGVRYFLRLAPYFHPTGAAPLVLGTLAYDSNNKATFTITQEGRMISEAGALTVATDTNDKIAGMLLGDYFWQMSDNAKELEEYRITQIEPGDFLWVVREGIVFLDADGSCTIDRYAVPTATGEVTMAADFDTSSVANYHTSVKNNIVAQDNFFAVARFLETRVGAGLVKAKLELSSRMNR